jgi:dCMP deaminase
VEDRGELRGRERLETQVERLSHTAYFMGMAVQAARRSTCPRRMVGCVITSQDNFVLATGHNGAPSGFRHCMQEGCLMVDGHCVRTLHAELNAVRGASFSAREAHIAYCTDQPCVACVKTMFAFGVRYVVYVRPYEDNARDAFVRDVSMVVSSMLELDFLTTLEERAEVINNFSLIGGL